MSLPKFSRGERVLYVVRDSNGSFQILAAKITAVGSHSSYDPRQYRIAAFAVADGDIPGILLQRTVSERSIFSYSELEKLYSHLEEAISRENLL